MESINDVLSWLTDHESAFSAIAALVVIFGVVLSPLGAGIRGLLTGRGHSKQNEVSTSAATGIKEINFPATQDFLNTPPPLITDKPSIAVLPFVNMSKDEDKEFFADGMTEDIITGLSCDSRLFVIARNSTFAYKGQTPDIRTVGKELGVSYVLEGSIRPVGERLRITVQLIETATGAHVWADKIDRPTAEIFDIMDDVVDGLVTSLCSNLGVAEGKRAQRQRPEDLQAWALCVQAEVLFFTQPDATTYLEAQSLAQRASEIEPGYAISWALLAWMISTRIVWGRSVDLSKDADEALSLITKAIRLAPQDPTVLGYCGIAASWIGEAAPGLGYLERSLSVNPNNSNVQIAYGFALLVDARPEQGLKQLELFLKRSPRDPSIAMATFFVSWCHLALGNFPEAELAARESVKHWTGFVWAHLAIAMSLSAMDRDSEAQEQMQIVHQLEPTWTRERIEDLWRLQLRKPDAAENMIALVRQAWRD
jgi:adenylate cyclase